MSALVTAELRKVLTLRFWWALALAPLVVALFAGSIYAAMADGLDSVDADLSTGAVSVGLVVAIAWAVLFAGIFGAVNAGTEFRHQTLTPTFVTTRGRDPVLAAKLAVTALFGLGYAVAVELVALGCMVVFGGDRFTVTSAILGMLAAGVVATVAWSLIGAGLGLLFASPTAAAITLVAWYPVGELITIAILSGLGAGSIGQWLPGAVTWSTVVSPAGDVDGFAPWPAAVIALITWTAVAAGLGWWTTRRRDVT
ncbi:ABC transporter permease [Rhodococcus sp. NPDC003322]